MNGYDLSRSFWDFSFENPEKIKPIHSAIFFFAIEHCNRLGWKDKFGFPTTMTMDAIGVKSYNTYIKALNELVDFGFIKMVQRSKNQYSANIIALSNFDKALDKALDKAFTKHRSKQSESTVQSTVSIDKQINNKQENKETNKPEEVFSFEDFWKKYPKKIAKKKCKGKWDKLNKDQKKKIEDTLDTFISYKPFPTYTYPNPETYFNQERWEDELVQNPNQQPKKSGEYCWKWSGQAKKYGSREQYESDKSMFEQFNFKTLNTPDHA